ncbi:MAG: DnaD domain protein [Bacilli bacterium]|nr:DnaD domain protein [Bacilli bacterium]
MVVLSYNDMFDVRAHSLLADYDRDTLTNLYQPIIGYTSLAVYFTLWSESRNQNVLAFSTHEQLLSRMKMPAGSFVEARKFLEGVGLLKTKLEKVNNTNIYHYSIYAPSTPKDFFGDALLFGMLIKALGEEDAEKFKKVYEYSSNQVDGEDISSSFNDAFQFDINEPSFLKAATSSSNNSVGRNKRAIKTAFNYDQFFLELSKISTITQNQITKKEIKEVERLATLYGTSEETAAYFVINCFDGEKDKGSRIDLKLLSDQFMKETNYSLVSHHKKGKSSTVKSDTLLANKINLFEKTSPKDVLSLLQNGTRPATSDLKIIDMLSKDYCLNNGVINVLIDFVLSMNKNILSRGYAEKIAASFNRENINTTIDAMNYCNSVIESKTKKTSKKVKATMSENKNNGKINEEEWNSLFEEKKGDDDNGKTDSELPF